VDPAAWLREKGFDPEGDLCAAIVSNYGDTTTAIGEAAWAGELGVCRFLWEHGAASAVRTKNSNSSEGWTPMYAACFGGHLHVAKWLFEKGAAEDIRTTDNNGSTPLSRSCRHLDVAAWLVLQGAANNDEGHVDQAILQRDVRAGHLPNLIPPLQLLVNENTAFKPLVLTATRFAAVPQDGAPLHRSKRRANPTPRCALALLRGFEGSVLRLIADFAGVVRGRQLRNALEALRAFGHRCSSPLRRASAAGARCYRELSPWRPAALAPQGP